MRKAQKEEKMRGIKARRSLFVGILSVICAFSACGGTGGTHEHDLIKFSSKKAYVRLEKLLYNG